MGTRTDQAPWLTLYDELPQHIEPRHRTALDLARTGIDLLGDAPLVWYFDTPISAREIDEASDALAVEFVEHGLVPGDRIVLQLQNMPSAMVGMLAAWKMGGIAVWANPMYRDRELRYIVVDSGARAFVGLAEQWQDVVAPALDGTDVTLAISTTGGEYEADSAVLPSEADTSPEALRLDAIVASRRGESPTPLSVGPDDVATLVYTSGTTGPPKGAMTLHRNLAFVVHVWERWMELGRGDCLFAVAPVFHITGLVCNLVLPLHLPAPVVLTYRFEPGEALRLIEARRATFTVAAITAFASMMNHARFAEFDLGSLEKIFSGGAPIAPASVERWQAATGTYIHNAYGMTESTTATHFVPRGRVAPVDPVSGALSIGLPVSDTHAEIVDEQGRPVSAGTIGELVMTGPQICGGYWGNPDETSRALPGGRLHSGDVGFMDPHGWFYIVDRSKDLIVASGYKVWPREVEDVLLEHEAIWEAAVVGVADDYRGETPKAFVSLRPGMSVTEGELEAFCRRRLAAYKVPRQFEFLSELPKTSSGKILRRELRDD